MQEVRQPRRSSAAHVGQTASRDADGKRRPEDAGEEVGDPIRAQLGVGVGRAKGPVATLKVLDDSRGDQDVDGSHERQPERARQYLGDILRAPGEPGERGQ